MNLEELARWLETQGTSQCFSGDIPKILAATAACRELERRRTQPVLIDHEEREETDRRLKECQ